MRLSKKKFWSVLMVKKALMPCYWELFAQFYYRDVNVPEYCRYYSREGHAFKTQEKCVY